MAFRVIFIYYFQVSLSVFFLFSSLVFVLRTIELSTSSKIRFLNRFLQVRAFILKFYFSYSLQYSICFAALILDKQVVDKNFVNFIQINYNVVLKKPDQLLETYIGRSTFQIIQRNESILRYQSSNQNGRKRLTNCIPSYHGPATKSNIRQERNCQKTRQTIQKRILKTGHVVWTLS